MTLLFQDCKLSVDTRIIKPYFDGNLGDQGREKTETNHGLIELSTFQNEGFLLLRGHFSAIQIPLFVTTNKQKETKGQLRLLVVRRTPWFRLTEGLLCKVFFQKNGKMHFCDRRF